MPKSARIPRPVVAVRPWVVSFSVLTRPDLDSISIVTGQSVGEIRRSLSEALRGHGDSLDTDRVMFDRWRALVGPCWVDYVVHSPCHVIVVEVAVRGRNRQERIHAELLRG